MGPWLYGLKCIARDITLNIINSFESLVRFWFAYVGSIMESSTQEKSSTRTKKERILLIHGEIAAIILPILKTSSIGRNPVDCRQDLLIALLSLYFNQAHYFI